MKKNKKKKNIVLRVLIIIGMVILVAFIVASCVVMYYMKHYRHEFYKVQPGYIEINTTSDFVYDSYHIKINRYNNKIKVVSKSLCNLPEEECKTDFKRASGVLTDDEVNYILEGLSKKPEGNDLKDIASNIYWMVDDKQNK